jgi:hypothetical protein
MNHILAIGLLSIVSLFAGCAASRTAATPTNCPVCGKPVADGPEVRVVPVVASEPGTRYRCFMCPIMEGKSGETWTLRAVSGVDGAWVTFRVDHDHVESDPPTAVVLAQKVGPGDECLDVHRVFTDEDEFRRYVAAHPDVKECKPRKFEDVLKENRK